MKNDLRRDIEDKILTSSKPHTIIEAATGIGKTKLALQKVAQCYTFKCNILIVVPRNVLKDNWRDEFKKWHYEYMLPNVTFTTYVSFHKHTGHWDIVIFDEAHHLSGRCQDVLSLYRIDHALYLSATLKRDTKNFIYDFHGERNIEFVRVTTKKAIEENVLPEPKILLIPLELDNKEANLEYYPKKKFNKLSIKCMTVPYKEKWKYRNSKIPYKLLCTQRQYYNEISGLIEWYKRKNFNPIMKNIWLHKCNDRLMWLSLQKTDIVKLILSKLPDKVRSITFSGDTKQANILGIPQVTYKKGTDNLTAFNNKEINKIVCVNMLDEGLNPVDCQIGILQMLNSSGRLQCQRIGRILRHKKPLIIIPYFKNTRDEEIVKGIKEEYKDMTYTIDNVEQIKDYL